MLTNQILGPGPGQAWAPGTRGMHGRDYRPHGLTWARPGRSWAPSWAMAWHAGDAAPWDPVSVSAREQIGPAAVTLGQAWAMPWAANSAPWAMHGRAPSDALGGRRGDPIGRPGLALTMTRPDGLTRGIRTA